MALLGWLLTSLLAVLVTAGLVTAGLVTAGEAAEAALTYNILIAGFGPFSENGTDFTANPAAQTALFLDDSCFPLSDLTPAASTATSGSRVCFQGWNVSVTHFGAGQVSRALRRGELQRAGIDAVIHLGLENSAKGLKVELVGANTLAASPIEGAKIEPWGPPLSPVTLDLGRLQVLEAALEPIVAAENRNQGNGQMNRADNKTVGETWSRDAGAFYCNEALYRTSNTVREMSIFAPRSSDRLLPVVFVHLPPSDVAPVETVVGPSVASLGAAILVDAFWEKDGASCRH